jgi:hypothetical protein
VNRQNCDKSAQQQSQSAVAPCTGGLSLDSVFRVTRSLQKSMTDINDAVSEEDKIMAETNIVIKLTNCNGN